ncbi:hypothetical protein OG921_16215 [Aldersonia sp. NBC_00410]|uniref:hypothetical protein n=1 Tax=Aldersonia sp. NBC_00410 TaxID=2975954 RepID=UPI002254F349|nr:hypothetical protein [Aldersonia sp. NBC_00410]MCX5044710.1 hypothetical protein [Aldersonia sp. NBC_00410]
MTRKARKGKVTFSVEGSSASFRCTLTTKQLWKILILIFSVAGTAATQPDITSAALHAVLGIAHGLAAVPAA